jgi:uncharacterized protein (TIGR02391 family)
VSGSLDRFERVVRSISVEVFEPSLFPTAIDEQKDPHPFDVRNIHPELPIKVRELFDDGHCEQSVFEAFKFIEKEVKHISGIRGKTGYGLMMEAFSENSPKVQLNGLATESETDEQMGFKFIFAGAATGIRNPRGHEIDIGDTPDQALDFLALASLLLRRLDAAGLR